MRLLLLAYIGVYVIVFIGAFAVYFRSSPRDGEVADSAAENALDVLLLAIGLAGMLLLWRQHESETLRHVWKFVSVTLVLAQLSLNLHARAKRIRTDPNLSSTFVRAADFGILLFLLPSLALNLAYAFG